MSRGLVVLILMLSGCQLFDSGDEKRVTCEAECLDCREFQHRCEFERAEDERGAKPSGV